MDTSWHTLPSSLAIHLFPFSEFLHLPLPSYGSQRAISVFKCLSVPQFLHPRNEVVPRGLAGLFLFQWYSTQYVFKGVWVGH